MRTLILAVALVAVSTTAAQDPTARAAPQVSVSPAGATVGAPGATVGAPGQMVGAPGPIVGAPGETGVAGLSAGALQLLTLDGEFSKAVAKGGGAAFVQWFADDAVTLSNGRPPVLTKAGIAASARWKPGEYTLQWIPMGAQMGPSGDMGFTWGHYDATTTLPRGQTPKVQSGRYITIWKRQADGKWKVALDASADEPKP